MPKGAVPEPYLDILASTALGHLATVGPDGRPQVNPVWFLSDGRSVSLSVKPETAKYRNLRANPSVAMSVGDPARPDRYLEIRGTVERFEEDPDLEFISAMSRKYIGVHPYPNHRPGDERVVVFVRPLHTTHKNG